LRFLLDGAHNPAGVLTLKEALLRDFPHARLIMVWGSMADKDMTATLGMITPLCNSLVFTMPESERSATPEALASLLPAEHTIKIVLTRTVSEALDRAQQLVNNPDDLVCIAGSLYLVGAARQILLGELTP
jgi:dihydrofolate synthase/folylpolyglutamate synthase